MSICGTTAPATFPPPPSAIRVASVKARSRANSVILATAEMKDVASFQFAGGTVAVFTTPSPGKTSPNEDVACLIAIDATQGVLAVADGLGGHSSGERASRLAVETIEKTICRELDRAGPNSNGEQLRPAILNGIESANAKVMQIGTGAATTLALVEIDGRSIRPYHVGDSAILLTGQRGKLKLQTIPHSPIGYAVEAGLIDEKDAMSHEERHMISNVIGSEEMRMEIGPSIQMAPRDTLLLASDGLLDNMLQSEIVDHIRTGSLNKAVARLVEVARSRMQRDEAGTPSKPDDLTVIAYRPR